MHTNAGIRVVTHSSTVQRVFVKARDTQSGREKEGLQKGMLVWVCVCASLIGQMCCVHYKRGTLVRWEAVSSGIRSVGQQSSRPQGGLSVGLTRRMEPMRHVAHVW